MAYRESVFAYSHFVCFDTCMNLDSRGLEVTLAEICTLYRPEVKQSTESRCCSSYLLLPSFSVSARGRRIPFLAQPLRSDVSDKPETDETLSAAGRGTRFYLSGSDGKMESFVYLSSYCMLCTGGS